MTFYKIFIYRKPIKIWNKFKQIIKKPRENEIHIKKSGDQFVWLVPSIHESSTIRIFIQSILYNLENRKRIQLVKCQTSIRINISFVSWDVDILHRSPFCGGDCKTYVMLIYCCYHYKKTFRQLAFFSFFILFWIKW